MYLGEVRRKSPEREEERVTSSTRTSFAASLRKISPVRTSSATSASCAMESDSSNNEDKDAIRLQEFKVEMETGKLAKMKARYARKRAERK